MGILDHCLYFSGTGMIVRHHRILSTLHRASGGQKDSKDIRYFCFKNCNQIRWPTYLTATLQWVFLNEIYFLLLKSLLQRRDKLHFSEMFCIQHSESFLVETLRVSEDFTVERMSIPFCSKNWYIQQASSKYCSRIILHIRYRTQS